MEALVELPKSLQDLFLLFNICDQICGAQMERPLALLEATPGTETYPLISTRPCNTRSQLVSLVFGMRFQFAALSIS